MPPILDSQHLLLFAMNVARAFAWLVIVTLVFLPLERLFALHPRKFLSKALAQDLSYYFISSIVPGLLLAVPLSLAAVGAHAVVPWRLQTAIAAWPLWLCVAVGIVVSEIGFYWGHRLSHIIPFLWRFHAIHHSAEEIYFLISARAHPVDTVFTRLFGLVPVYALGLANSSSAKGGLVTTSIVLITIFWGFFIHSNLRVRLGPLEWLVVTPAFHHWHHTKNDHKDHNFAANLPLADWLFGTFYLPKSWPAVYGTDTAVPATLGSQLLDPLTSAAIVPARQNAAGLKE